ncbi:MAG: hypothetical protein V1646_02925 [bacterium]
MKIKFFLLSSFIVVFSTLNCMLAIKVDGGPVINCSSYHDVVGHRLDLSNLGLSDSTFKALLVDIIFFVNNNKVETLLLEGNNFESPSMDLMRWVAGLLTSCPTLKTVSLKNNFKKTTRSDRGISPAILEQITTGIAQFQALFKESLTYASQQTKTEYITKEILFDDMPPLSIISEIKLPLTGCERFRTFLVKFGVGLASMIVSTGGTILTIYLTGNFGGTGCPCPSNSTIS